MLSPLLYALFTHDCLHAHVTNTIVKFADDITIIGLITNNDEYAYRDELRNLTAWCSNNNLILNIKKTKEIVVDFSKTKTIDLSPVFINGVAVERVTSFKFLGLNITEDFSWTTHSKGTATSLFSFLIQKHLVNFYRCAGESVLTYCITS